MMYRGEQFDSDLGLYYLRARYYNPLTGRLMSRDPFSGFLQLPTTQHKYNYARANPTNRIDPSGQIDLGDFAGLVARAAKAVPVLSAISCGTSLGFIAGVAAAQWYGGEEVEPPNGEPNGLLTTLIGCATLFVPEGSAAGEFLQTIPMKVVLNGLGFTGCVTGLVHSVTDENNALANPTPKNVATFGTDLSTSVFSFAVGGIGSLFDLAGS